MEKKEILRKSRAWVERFVIGLQLCPFARQPYEKGQVRFEVCLHAVPEDQLMAFWSEVELLESTPPEEISNAILILPKGVDDFGHYLNLFHLAEQLLLEKNKNTLLQIAGFHPQYQFKGTGKNDSANYTNRSPFPFIHILRVEEVAAAIANYPDIEKVPQRNIDKLRKMGRDAIESLIDL